VLSSKLLSTNLPGLDKAKIAPQKTNPNPMNAKTCQLKRIDAARITMPNARNAEAVLREGGGDFGFFFNKTPFKSIFFFKKNVNYEVKAAVSAFLGPLRLYRFWQNLFMA